MCNCSQCNSYECSCPCHEWMPLVPPMWNDSDIIYDRSDNVYKFRSETNNTQALVIRVDFKNKVRLT